MYIGFLLNYCPFHWACRIPAELYCDPAELDSLSPQADLLGQVGYRQWFGQVPLHVFENGRDRLLAASAAAMASSRAYCSRCRTRCTISFRYIGPAPGGPRRSRWSAKRSTAPTRAPSGVWLHLQQPQVCHRRNAAFLGAQ